VKLRERSNGGELCSALGNTVACLKNSAVAGIPGLANLRQGSGVTPDSGKTVLRSGVVRELPETAGQRARPPRSRLLPKSFAIKMPAVGFHTGAVTFF
jgi:hypothetical protein